MLFHTLYDPQAGMYVGQLNYELQGELDVAAFERAWQTVVERHPALRTAFVWEGLEQPLQIVRQKVEVPWERQDWRGLPAPIQEQWLRGFLRADRERGFEPGHAPLMRLALIRCDERAYQFVWSFHQMVMDGWSLPLLHSEVAAFYSAFSQGRELRLPIPRPYKEYIAWLRGRDAGLAEAFWRRTLSGFTAPTPLTVDLLPGKAAPGYGERQCQLSRAATAALEGLARRHALTLNTITQGAWGLLLARYSGEDDVVFGATVSGRPPALPGVESMVGLFINTLPVRVRIEPAETVLPWLKRLQQEQAEQRQYEWSPLVDIQRWSEVGPGRPLFETILVFENYPQDDAIEGGSAAVQISDLKVAEQANYPLAVGVEMVPDLVLRINHDTARVHPLAVARMLEHLRALLESFVRAPHAEPRELALLTANESHQILLEWSDTARSGAGARPVHELFADQVERTPEAPALAFGGERLTYRELDRSARRLANYLRELGVGCDVPVGLCLERSLEMVIGMLAVWKAGGVYVPLDPAYPADRLRFMLEDSGARVLVSTRDIACELPAGIRRVLLDTEREAIAAAGEGDPVGAAAAGSLAYMIYTSGTTGRPKAVLVEHGNLAHTLEGALSKFGFGFGDTMPHIASFSFDISLLELWLPLASGGMSRLLTRDDVLDLEGLVTQLAAATHFHAVPSLLRQIVQHVSASGEARPDLSRIRRIFTGGDAVPPDLLAAVRSAFPAADVTVLYGPTEGTIICSAYMVPAGGAERSLLGRPLDNVGLQVVDRGLHPVPIGVPGEVLIAGAGVTRGYLDRGELTREKYLSREGGRVYRTGDLARYLPDGNLEFLGRIDHQVKVRGFRVELGEIEAVLAAHADVGEALVAVHQEDSAGRDGSAHPERRLVAYVVPNNGVTPAAGELRRFLHERLPEYMVPAFFVPLAALPLTGTGKVDRNALPSPEDARPDLEGAFIAPRSRSEDALAAIWAEVLGVEHVGVHDNFFDLGGDSILSLQIVAKASRAGLRLSPKQIFEAPTIAELARVMRQAPQVRVERGPVVGPAPLIPVQRRFFELDPPEPHHFNLPILLEVRQALQVPAVERVLDHVLRHHDALRLRFLREEGTWRQLHAAPGGASPLTLVDLSTLPQEEQARRIPAVAGEVQKSFDLANGPLLRLVLFNLGGGRSGRLFMVMHHLVADGISQGIVLEDLEAGYQQLMRGEAITAAAQDHLVPLLDGAARGACPFERSTRGGGVLDLRGAGAGRAAAGRASGRRQRRALRLVGVLLARARRDRELPARGAAGLSHPAPRGPARGVGPHPHPLGRHGLAPGVARGAWARDALR